VTAMPASSLISLGRKPFLELVEAGPGLTYTLLDIHRGTVTGAEEEATMDSSGGG
jgi:hypothetical protein